MPAGNWTHITEFILVGLTEDPSLQIPLFCFFLLVYGVTFICNIGIIQLVLMNTNLHTPMYFFLCTLSFVDISFSSAILPNMLVNFLWVERRISLTGCATQMFFSFAIGSTEVFTMALMAYDRYTAICNPLLYPVIMNSRTCLVLLFGACVIALINGLTQTIFTFTLPFCNDNKINHFFCDVPALLKLACSDTTINEVVLVSVAGGLILISAIIILASYVYIVSAILKISSSEGRWKTFSTCSSHLVCVTLYFSTLIFMYIKPSSIHATTKDNAASLCYTLIIPMLNPLIYSLRNQEIKRALRKGLGIPSASQ
ncbi:olfactory receptor OR9H1-like [Lissotriton helveticus]